MAVFERSIGWVARLTLFGTILAGTICVAGTRQTRNAAAAVDAANIRRHTVVLGSDALQGRRPGTIGGSRAAAYIAAELDRLGVSPFGEDGTYFQNVPLHGNTPLAASRLNLRSLGEVRHLELGRDYLLYTTGSQTWIPRAAPLVFVGYGIVAPEFDHNDYAEIDVRGKVVVLLAGEPRSEDPDYFAGEEPSVYSSPEAKQRTALSRGAVGSVEIQLTEIPELLWSRLKNEFSFEHLTLAYTVPRHLSLRLHPRLVPQLFVDALYDFEQVRAMARDNTLRAFHLPVSLTFEGSFRSRNFLAPNVVGVVEGSDPGLRGTYVVVSAHYDHLGVGPAVDGDAVYNGVVDNALGVAGVLELARVIVEREGPPGRSIIFLFSTAEEEGNLGASFFLDHPPVPLSRMVANVNVDGLAFLDEFKNVVGIGGDLSDLGEMLRKALKPLDLETSRPREMVLGHAAYSRSDQVVFAEAGIPAILVVEGFDWKSTERERAVERTAAWFATTYHMPSDDGAQPLDFSASRQHCAAVLAMVLAVAENPAAPEWRPGVPYAYQRLLSLADERD